VLFNYLKVPAVRDIRMHFMGLGGFGAAGRI
jgi:hypothetical protein